jgi:hypothetical protein
LRSKKSRIAAKGFLELLHEIANYRSTDLRPEKKASSTDEPLGLLTKIFFNGYLWQ